MSKTLRFGYIIGKCALRHRMTLKDTAELTAVAALCILRSSSPTAKMYLGQAKNIVKRYA